jgi:hypothetical protein
MLRTVTALLATIVLVAACSSKPVSQATEQSAAPAATAAPSASAETGQGDGAGQSPEAPPATAAPAISIAPGVPPKPGSPTWVLLDQATDTATGTITERYRVTWTEPEAVADQFLVFGVKGCLREAKKYDGKPCVVKGMPIPKDTLVQLGAAPGDARELEVEIEVPAGAGPPPYGAILIRATNGSEKSIFTIVHSEDVCWKCTY